MACVTEARSRPGTTCGVLLAAILTSSCTLYGPDAARVSHIAYNEAVQESEQRELLLNLVRLRYTESPEFLAISNISTQMRFEAQASVSGQFGTVESATSSFAAPGVIFGYSESPTVIFTPQQGVDFTRRLVAPIGIDSLYLLTQYGWGLDRTLRIIAQDVNGVSNLTSREAMTPEDSKSLHDFASLTTGIQSLYQRHVINLVVRQRVRALSASLPEAQVTPDDLLKAAAAGYRYEYSPDPPSYRLLGTTQHYVLTANPQADDVATLDGITRILGLPAGAREYEVDPAGDEQADWPALRVRTRSVLGAMAYLSSAVTVPETHIRNGMALPHASQSNPIEELLKVRVAATKPDDLAVVPYRGFWFYIDDGDLESKRTLGLLTSLVRLEIGAGGAENVPVLTLPVAR